PLGIERDSGRRADALQTPDDRVHPLVDRRAGRLDVCLGEGRAELALEFLVVVADRHPAHAFLGVRADQPAEWRADDRVLDAKSGTCAPHISGRHAEGVPRPLVDATTRPVARLVCRSTYSVPLA